jgi:BMFP domain-containing protein YqiC
MLEDLRTTILKLLPAEVGDELKQNIDAAIQGQFEQMNLATREQLEIQEKILKRTLDRVEQLEKLVAVLEKNKDRTSIS